MKIKLISLFLFSLFLFCSKDKNPISPGEMNANVKDVDGNVYKMVKVGDQRWMAENLKVAHFRNGDPIPDVTDATSWSNLITGAYCNYENTEANVTTYGRLYNWFAVSDERNIAPVGWHVPTDEEWKRFEVYLGMSQAETDNFDYRGRYEGGKMKEAGTAHWASPNTGATNESGLSALPGGCRSYRGTFYEEGDDAFFWSSTECDSMNAWGRGLAASASGVYRFYLGKQSGLSVRCVMD